MTATHILAAGVTHYTAIGAMLAILVPDCAALAVIAGWYFRLQRNRADAATLASYRKLAEETVASQAVLRYQLARLTMLTGHVGAEERLTKRVG